MNFMHLSRVRILVNEIRFNAIEYDLHSGKQINNCMETLRIYI